MAVTHWWWAACLCLLRVSASVGHLWPEERFHRHLAEQALRAHGHGDAGSGDGNQSAANNRHFTCGSSHPNITRFFAPEVTVSQGYHTVESARRLRDQSYPMTSTGGFLSLADADAMGLATPIRISVVWTALESTEFSGVNSGPASRQCTAAGRTIAVECVIGGSPSCSTTCSEEDVVLPGSDRFSVIQERVTWATQYYSSALKVKPVLDPIVVDPFVTSTFNLGATTVPDTDLVIIVTARPSPFAAVAAYATCLQRDQYGRCTVGRFNWVPSALEPAKRDLPASIT
jgi:hypothetical protein